jgi:hypothetical protein
MAQPITADEGDANVAWDIQTGISMPSPYPNVYANGVAVAQMPPAAQMAQIGVDISTTQEMRDYYRFVHFTD